MTRTTGWLLKNWDYMQKKRKRWQKDTPFLLCVRNFDVRRLMMSYIIRCADNRKELENLLISKYLTYEPPLDKRHGIAAMVGTALLMVA
ncbi:MAG: hypothetical protein MJ001_05325 [Paludibacteraceae bacterium]|nr:hypothetical protein [Paludibacteraceae bacterium]